ncbi:MAG: ketopantoate reductase family protein [Gammaproteobacteria bacterium]|nr:ketopantoate reductase family protein [Gammaproteobacteria bacterium]
MRVLILAAGAVGLCLAARLSAHCEVHALCRPRHAQRIARSGFRMHGIWGEGSYHFPADARLPDNSTFDYSIVTAKSLQTRALCEQYRETLARCDCVSLQNGIGNEEILAEYAAGVIGGTIITGFEWRGDAAVEVTVEAGPIRLGRFPRGSDAAVERLIGLFREAGLDVEGSDSIQTQLWAKTLYNCALNPLGAILDLPYGALAAAPSWSIIEHLIEEAFRVCRAETVELPWSDAAGYLDYLREVQLPATAGHHSSMLQDIRNRRQTEIDFLNGAIERLASRHGIEAPVNATLAALIRSKSG